ncbi:glycosyltransferase [Streptococcus sp. HMSC062D07]|uniref:glycosyltransferase family 4 protein n=1 Tax=Streptococcus sp. HMSC062D07 TaxID=1739461 RepID=UPI0008A617AC|nr:glycosyltransferase family 4 protein [Streptococcus sp. HMSC062D07]OFQ06876.1 glycosyltransferase [Streptococcus sp. HMSC062D07]
MKNENRKNSILHISRTMDIGGAERIVYQLSSDLKDEFDSVHVASTGGLWESELAAQGIQHHKILDIDSKNPVTVLKLLFSIHQIIKQKGITIVHTHHRMAAFYIRLLKLVHPKLIHVYTAHNVFKDKLPLYGFALKNAKSVAVGEAVNKNLKEDVGITDSRVIYNGVVLKETDEQVDEIISYDGIKLGCIARLSEQKGLTYLLDAMSLLTVKDIRLFIVGDGELRNELENKVKELHLQDSVTFLGYRKDIAECINSFDFCVLPSVFEGFGLVAIEAFMNSKTLVATAIPGLNEVVTNENGVLVPAKDPAALASAIDKLAMDATLRQELSSQAKKDYENKFSYPMFLENYRALYRELKGESK